MSQERIRPALERAALAAKASARALENDAAKLGRAASAARRSEAAARKDPAAVLRAPSWARYPVAAAAWRAYSRVALAGKAAEAEGKARAYAAAAARKEAGRDSALAAAARLMGAGSAMSDTALALAGMREPAVLPPAAEEAVRAMLAASRVGAGDAEAILRAGAAGVAAARALRAFSREAAQAVRAGAPETSPHRVYLPVPYATGRQAKRLGAGYDEGAEPGSGSRWFVPAGKPLAPFESFLPLAYRRDAPKLSFPPVRHGASGQNLWTLFDRGTWDQIRHINYDRTGRRCVLCGGQSGSLLKAIGDRSDGGGLVDCHEIWEWKVPDPSVALGVQRLRGLLVVCFECHASFHDGFARRRGRERGMEDEVRRFLMKRRSFLVRKPAVEVASQMAEDARRLRAHSGVKAWIVDLAHLGRQDYMRHVDPVFVEKNAAGVDPALVAGLSFVSDSGTRWPAASAREVFGTLSDLYRDWPSRPPKDGAEEGFRAMGR